MNAAVPSSRTTSGGRHAGEVGPPAEQQAGAAEHDQLQTTHDQHADRPAGDEAAAAERGGAEQPQHAVAPVEGGRRSPGR